MARTSNISQEQIFRFLFVGLTSLFLLVDIYFLPFWRLEVNVKVTTWLQIVIFSLHPYMVKRGQERALT
jgi:hypothetical protein